MKKLLILLASAMLLLTSCGDRYSRTDDFIHWSVIPIDIRADQWEERDGYLMVKVSVPELTERVCKEGMVQCYVVFEDNTQALLPSTRYCSADYIDEVTGEPYTILYQRLLDYEFGPGYVYLYYTISDFSYADDWPNNMTLRVVIQR